MRNISFIFIGWILSNFLVTSEAHSQESAGTTVGLSKPVIGVLKFQDETGAMFTQGGVGRALSTMLTNELSARPSLTIVQRQKLRP